MRMAAEAEGSADGAVCGGAVTEAMRAGTNLRNEMDEPGTRIAEKRAAGRDCGRRCINARSLVERRKFRSAEKSGAKKNQSGGEFFSSCWISRSSICCMSALRRKK